MGLTLIWGVMSVINLAHGPVIALGMFGTYLLFTHLGVNPYLGMVPVAGGPDRRPGDLRRRGAPGD